MGLKIKLPEPFTDTTLPVLREDSLMNDGSLLLIDFGREATAPRSSVPAHNANLGNLAWQTAAAVIGSGDEASLSAKFENTLIGVPAMGLVERTAKYGIHVIASQTANDSSNRHAGISLPAPVISHIWTNTPGRTFYISVWGRVTRVPTAGTTSDGYLGSVTSLNFHAFAFYTPPALSPISSSSAFVGSQVTPSSNVVGNYFKAVAWDDWTGTKPTLVNTVGKLWFGQQGIVVSFQQNGAASGVLYRVYAEDLTASGRSYAATVAADRALYDAAFGTGGRFSGDTFTSPSTIP